MAAPTSAHRRRIKHLASGAATLRLPALARSSLGTLLTNRGPMLSTDRETQFTGPSAGVCAGPDVAQMAAAQDGLERLAAEPKEQHYPCSPGPG